MLTFQKISYIFSKFLDNTLIDANKIENLDRLIKSCIEINQKIWKLEDIARMKELGTESIALAKYQIDESNQIRNNLIYKIDLEIEKMIKNDPSGPKEKFYAESPGTIIDRLAILSIKLSVIRKITTLITDEYLKVEYLDKGNAVSNQIDEIGAFLDLYFLKIKKGDVFFKVQKSIKIYNDKRVRVYIKNVMGKNLS